MIYRDDDLHKTKIQNQDLLFQELELQNMRLLGDKQTLTDEVFILRAQVPTKPFLWTTGVINVVILFLVGCLIAMAGIFVVEVRKLHQESVVVVQEEVKAPQVQRVVTHPVVHPLEFGEVISGSTLQPFEAQGADRTFYSFQQLSDSFLAVDVNLFFQGRSSLEGILEVYATGHKRPIYQEVLTSKVVSLFLPQGDYRMRVSLHNPNNLINQPPVPWSASIYRLQREPF